MRPSRRQFLESAVGTGLSLGFLSQLDPVSAAQAKLDPAVVKLDDSIEPTVRLLEESPRERVLEEVAGRIKRGMSYREVLTALFLAGVRNVQPRPQVGFKFHAVLVINSAHLASINSPDSDRWLPIFWAIDRFKSAQLETQKTSGWRMSSVEESRLPVAGKARESFVHAMDNWDEGEADLAAAAMARTATRNECFDLFAHYGARDFRDIGHKAIYVANSFRTLDAIGWHHAEPVLRSLAYALLQHDGENPARSPADADLYWQSNLELVKKIRPDWQGGRTTEDSSKRLLDVFRTGNDKTAPAQVVEALNNGASADAIWDAVLSGAAELLMRKTNIVTLHSVTSANALHYAFKTVSDPTARVMLLLQNASFITLFRKAAGENSLSKDRIDAIEKPAGDAPSLDEIFDAKDKPAAARATLAYLDAGRDPNQLMHAARRLVFLKGNDAHDYKFSAAVLEDFYDLSPAWRNRYLAASMFYLPTNSAKDNALVNRIRAAFSA
jgi:hypothetical protein